jgi:hypothetical protein
MDREDRVEQDLSQAPLVYVSHFPSPAFRSDWTTGETPILLCLDDPVDSIRYMLQSGQKSAVEALRVGMAAAASFVELRGRARLLTLHRFTDAPAAAVIDTILHHLGFALSDEQRRSLHAGCGAGSPDASLESALKASVEHYASPDEPQAVVSPKQATMVAEALAPLLQMSFRETPGPVVWPIEAFFSGDRPDMPAALVTDLTGGARILYYGPYFHLPAGYWKVRLMVGFSAGARSMPFSVEVFAGQQPLAIATMAPEHRGVYHATFHFLHDQIENPIEVRLRSDRGAIEGQVALGRVEFVRERPQAYAPRAAAG